MADKNSSSKIQYFAEQYRKAEAKLAERRKKTDPLPSMDVDVRRLIYELEVHQIELEIQNEELMQARVEREAALDQYIDLYDFAPTGYFTLARDGAILRTNLTGAKLLGVERSKLLKKRFGLFVADEFRVAFINFIERIFECGGKESQDVLLGKRVGEPRWVLIEAVCTADKQKCRATVTDITARKQAEDKIRYQANLLNTVGQAVIATDLSGKIIYWNRFAESLYGWPADEATGKNIMDVNVSQTSKEQAAEIMGHVGAGKTWSGEFPVQRRDGTTFPAYVSNTPILDDQGLLTGIIGVSSDITERKETEKAFYDSKLMIEEIINTIPVRIYWKDKDLVFLGCNKIFAQDAGFSSPQEIIGKDDYQMGWLDQAELYRADDRLVIESGSPKLNIEEQQTTPNGDTITLLTSKIPLLDSQGQISGVLGSYLDITERKLAEEELTKANLLMEETGRMAKIGGWELDLSTMELYFTKGTFQIHELASHTPLTLEDAIKFYSPESQPLVKKAVEEAIEEKKPYSLELPFITAKGRNIWVRAQGRAYFEDGMPVRLFGTFQDITERKQAEAQLKLQSHALKSAANAIVITDLEGAIEWANPAFYALTGYSAEEVLGQNPRVLKSGKQEVGFYKNLWDTICSGKIWKGEIINKRKDGVLYTEEMTIAPLVSDDGKINSFVAVKEDISKRVQAQVALQQYASRLETLNTVTKALSTSLELDKVLELILTQIGYVIPFDSGAIFLYEEDGLHMVAQFGLTPSLKGQIFPAKNKLFRKIRETKKPLILNDVSGDVRFENWGVSANLGSWMGVPLFVRDSLIGNLTLDNDQPNAYSLEQAELALSFASQAAQAIENARLFQDATQRLGRMDALRKIDKAITGSFNLNVTLNVLLGQLQEKLEVDAAAVLQYENTVETLSFVQGLGFQTAWIRDTNLRLGQGLAGKVALDRRDLFIQDLDRSETPSLRSGEIKEEDFVSYYGIPLIAKGQLIGVLEIFHRSLLTPSDEWISFLQILAGQAAIAIDNITLYSDLQSSNSKLSLAYDATIKGWAQALELKDMETEGHSRRVVEITMDLARMLGYSAEDLAHIRRGALLHDIGKMGVPDAILQKPGKLNESEWQVMRQHPVYAYNWLFSIDYLKPALDIPYCHHERWDGTGYPRGLAGEKIPLGARIFAIVDVWDALRSDRPYRKAWSREKTLAYILAESAKHFDPQVVDAFIKYLDEGGDNQ